MIIQSLNMYSLFVSTSLFRVLFRRRVERLLTMREAVEGEVSALASVVLLLCSAISLVVCVLTCKKGKKGKKRKSTEFENWSNKTGGAGTETGDRLQQPAALGAKEDAIRRGLRRPVADPAYDTLNEMEDDEIFGRQKPQQDDINPMMPPGAAQRPEQMMTTPSPYSPAQYSPGGYPPQQGQVGALRSDDHGAFQVRQISRLSIASLSPLTLVW